MSQDIVSDVLNQMMNAKKARKGSIVVTRSTKLLKKILDIAKESGHIEYSVDGNKLKIELKNLNEIRAIKPRFTVSVDKINHYVRRYLPAKNFGYVIISTSKGLMRHYEAQEKNVGGCLVAYIF